MKTFFNYFSSVKLEMKKVSWSSKQELIGSTIIVFVFAIILGIFSKRINKEGAISGMIVGISLMLYYMAKFKLGWLGPIPPSSDWWFGISPEGFGSIAMLCNFLISIVVSYLTTPPPSKVVHLVENIRIPEN